MKLTLRWKRAEPGLWHAGPYILRRTRSGRFWRIEHNMVRIGAALTLAAAKSLCEVSYAVDTHNT